ncbi:exodeoxyribonuclease VII small subunit [Candidatus Pseudothioglobus singularis]|nr:exodeoxyribonuclease VII small subunit [Candidatus Pseudothioglobus singularis]
MSEEERELTFEQAMQQLEEIVDKLEEGDVPLESAINYYQKGMQLAKLCGDKLHAVQEQMTKIVNEQGEFEPFQIQEDET